MYSKENYLLIKGRNDGGLNKWEDDVYFIIIADL